MGARVEWMIDALLFSDLITMRGKEFIRLEFRRP